MSRSLKKGPGSPIRGGDAWLSDALMAAGDVAYQWDVGRGIISWSDNAAAVFGLTSISEIGKAEAFLDRIAGGGDEAGGDPGSPHQRVGDRERTFSVEYKFRRGYGGYCWLQDKGRYVPGGDGGPGRLTGTLRVVTADRERSARIRRLAFFDDLSGYLNRTGLRQAIDDAVFEARRAGGACSYLAIGIDNMSRINETFGYAAGDQVILSVGDRVETALASNGVVGRVGGNQFGVLLPATAGADMLARAHHLLESVRGTLVETDAGPVPVTISVGVVAMPGESRSGRDAMARAEDALAQAKDKGRDQLIVYARNPQVAADRRRNREMLEQVARAIREDRVMLAYQPIVQVPDGTVSTYECLIRMRSADGELIPAGSFMPVVERLGLIRAVDRHVMELAIRELMDHPTLGLAINTSGLTVTDAGWIDALTAHIGQYPEVAERLTVEITETAALRDPDESARFVGRLRSMGCRVALDDFGAGHSSFRQLKAMSVDILKIDGSFVRGIAENADNRLLVRTLIDLARGFGLETVAEWVESTEDANLLTGLGVDHLQGFLLGPPSLERPWLASHGRMPTITIPGLSPHMRAVAKIASTMAG